MADAQDVNGGGVSGAEWAGIAARELIAAAASLSEVGPSVARELWRNPTPDDKPFLVASERVEDGWRRVSEAIIKIGRARAAFENARVAARDIALANPPQDTP